MIFIDSGIWIAAEAPADQYHERASTLFHELHASGEHMVITESVLSEVVGFFARKGHFSGARLACEKMLNVNALELLVPAPEECAEAARFVEKFRLTSFTDALTMAVMESRGLRKLLSFDSDFDANKKIKRVF